MLVIMSKNLKRKKAGQYRYAINKVKTRAIITCLNTTSPKQENKQMKYIKLAIIFVKIMRDLG